jgi:deoxyribonuclease IV
MKLGLKLWSTNDFYINEAIRLYNEKLYDYVELFVVPDSLKYLQIWEKLEIPFILHAPHSYAGFNPSLAECKKNNLILLDVVEKYREALKPQYVIFHPGINGCLSETIRQFNFFREKFPEIYSIALIENKPAIGLEGEACVGCSVNDIIKIQNESGMGFCYDIGHSICYANSTGQAWKNVFCDFLELKPVMFHLSDGYINSSKDMHLNLGKGNFDLEYILSQMKKNASVSIETIKSSKEKLDDFFEDVRFLKSKKNNNLCFKKNCERLEYKPAKISDAELLLSWRNDLKTRKSSLNTNKIELREHLDWLAGTLKNNTVILYVVKESGRPVGTVRTDYNNNIHELSWTVAPSERRRGIGKKIVSEFVKQFNKPLKAVIRKENYQSIKIAEYSGFKFVEDNSGILHYIYKK